MQGYHHLLNAGLFKFVLFSLWHWLQTAAGMIRVVIGPMKILTFFSITKV